MESNLKINMAKIFLLFSVVLFSACDDYFTNPMKDKETGEDINLLILDFNFFKTRMTYQLKDAKTGEIIQQNATLTFSGKNAGDIVNYSGEKNENYQTTQGQIELTADPNVAISETAPFEFAITVEISGYNTLTRSISFQSEGVKTIELQLAKVSDETETEHTGGTEDGIDTVFHFSLPPVGIKSAQTAEYKINYTLTMSNLLKFTDEAGQLIFKSKEEALNAYKLDPENFLKVTISSFNEYQPGVEAVNINGTVRNALFHKLETGKLISIVMGGKKVGSFNGGVVLSDVTDPNDFLPKKLSFVKFENDAWKMLGDSIFHKSIEFTYTLATVSEEDLCSKGAAITFKSGVISSFSIVADVYDESNDLITVIYFKGNFPQTFVLENVPSKAAKLVFRNNNPAFKSIATLQVSNLCSGNYEVNIEPTTGYAQYQVVLKALCRENKLVAVAPTYSAEIKLKNSNDPWQGIEMKGGVIDLLGLPNADYEMRLLWKNDWEYSSYSTKFDGKGNYTGAPEPDTKIISKKLDDGRIQIYVERIFDQNICDDMGW